MSSPEQGDADEWSVSQRVRVYPGSADERAGVIVEDFGSAAGHPVDIGDHHIVDAAKRWAVALDDGSLVFVDSSGLAAD